MYMYSHACMAFKSLSMNISKIVLVKVTRPYITFAINSLCPKVLAFPSVQFSLQFEEFKLV